MILLYFNLTTVRTNLILKVLKEVKTNLACPTFSISNAVSMPSVLRDNSTES